VRDIDIAIVLAGGVIVAHVLNKQPIDYAISQIGVRELTDRNDGIPFERYAIRGEQPLAWCARFVRWAYESAGKQLPGNRWEIASVGNLQHAFAQAGAWLGLTDDIRRGDLILLNERGLSDAAGNQGGRHIGIVEAVDAEHVYSIDGNWGNMVARVRRRRNAPDIWGYARW
jgi:hypothetical protein